VWETHGHIDGERAHTPIGLKVRGKVASENTSSPVTWIDHLPGSTPGTSIHSSFRPSNLRNRLGGFMSHKVIHGDCREVMAGMDECSVDSIVTDPPYGLSFMGKGWDKGVPGVEFWVEALRVAKPGAHLLAFGGTRMVHRLAVAIEDAGWEIRDRIHWVYGSGFPKSHNVSKAIDKAAGAEREVVGQSIHSANRNAGSMATGKDSLSGYNTGGEGCRSITAPATPEAQQWDGWGTALKPAVENVIFATKPIPPQVECDTIVWNLLRLEAKLCLLISSVSGAEVHSWSNLSEGQLLDTAQWSAEELTSTRGDLLAQMDMSQLMSAASICLNTVLSWKNILAGLSQSGSMSITEMESKTTIGLRTLRCCTSEITPESIIKAASIHGGQWFNALPAAKILSESAAFLGSIQRLSAIGSAIDAGHISLRGEGELGFDNTAVEPIILARKPFKGTVAANVLEWGTGAINVDGCRVEGDDHAKAWDKPVSTNISAGAYVRPESRHTVDLSAYRPTGRFPANLIHDGSDEATAGMGDASRYFYCAKANKRDRGEGNNHPTVKPTDLMAYLCRLITPPGGTVLDPFNGSGSTGKAAVREGFNYIGIELDPEYAEIARARIASA
jgi:DNA modification methylase